MLTFDQTNQQTCIKEDGRCHLGGIHCHAPAPRIKMQVAVLRLWQDACKFFLDLIVLWRILQHCCVVC